MEALPKGTTEGAGVEVFWMTQTPVSKYYLTSFAPFSLSSPKGFGLGTLEPAPMGKPKSLSASYAANEGLCMEKGNRWAQQYLKPGLGGKRPVLTQTRPLKGTHAKILQRISKARVRQSCDTSPALLLTRAIMSSISQNTGPGETMLVALTNPRDSGRVLRRGRG